MNWFKKKDTTSDSSLLDFAGSTQKNESCFPKLTYTQRIYGFAFCMILGNSALIK